MPVPYFSTIFLPTILKDYLRTNRTVRFLYPLPRSFGIEIGLGPSHIIIFQTLLKNISVFQLTSPETMAKFTAEDFNVS
jgi:hypothetical protein